MATLPGGEALAGASALQCVINEQTGVNERPDGVVPKNDPPEDGYARIAGFVETWIIPDPGNPASDTTAQVFRVTVDTEEIAVYGDNPSPPFPAPGSWFDESIAVIPVPIAKSEAEFLYQYNADPAPIQDRSDVDVDPNTLLPTNCTLENIVWPGPPQSPAGPSVPTHCFHPMAVQAPQNNAGNVPLTYSCLASFQPTP